MVRPDLSSTGVAQPPGSTRTMCFGETEEQSNREERASGLRLPGPALEATVDTLGHCSVGLSGFLPPKTPLHLGQAPGCSGLSIAWRRALDTLCPPRCMRPFRLHSAWLSPRPAHGGKRGPGATQRGTIFNG